MLYPRGIRVYNSEYQNIFVTFASYKRKVSTKIISMEKENNPIYERNTLEFVTVALEFCTFVENAGNTGLFDFLDKAVKILPLLYLKATLLPEAEEDEDAEPELTVTEDMYESVRNRIAGLLGEKDSYLETFHPDMQYSDTPIAAFISENLADVYQDTGNFISLFRQGNEDVMLEAIVLCRKNFREFWGATSVKRIKSASRRAIQRRRTFRNQRRRMTQQYTHSITKEVISGLPLEEFTGRIIVIDTLRDVEKAISYLSEFQSVGFDTETRPSFKKGQRYKISLMQISTDEACFLFRLNRIDIPETLEEFLANEKVQKIGLSLRDDFGAMRKRTDIQPANFLDLQNYVGQFGIEDASLQKIYAILFNKKISKGQRLSNWEADVLSDAQKKYAALDAWACLKIYNQLKQI